MKTLTYGQARWLGLAFGMTVLAAVAASAFLRGADPVEVFAVSLFIPILAAVVFLGPVGGGVAGSAASIAYLTMRLSTLGGVEPTEFAGSIVARVMLYMAFGILGGVANRNLEQSLKKLEIYDEVDDLTGVGNARSLLSLADREAARAQRYQTTFSVGVLRLDATSLKGMARRPSEKAIRKFYGDVNRAVRTTDKVTRLATDEVEELTVIMPETGPEGARIFVDRARSGLTISLRDMGVPLADDGITGYSMTLPGDEDLLREHLDRIRALDNELVVAE